MADWKAALRDIKKAIAASSASSVPAEPTKRPPITSSQQHIPTNVVPARHKRQNRDAGLFSKSSPLNKGIKSPSVTTSKTVSIVRDRPTSVRITVDKKHTSPSPLNRAPQSPPQPKPSPVPSDFKPRRSPTLTRQAYFREPAQWVADGCQTQIVTLAGKHRFIDVVIGLDFGTSYTKAAVGLMDRIYAVRWDGTSSSPNAFLLPSEYTVLPDGSAMLGQFPGANTSQVKRDLKLPFANPAISSQSITTAAVFLALVLRYVRGWVFHYHGTKIGNAKIRWQLNLGAPSNGLEDDRLEQAYRRLGTSAWKLSEIPFSTSFADALEVVRAWQPDDRPATLEDLAICPEFVAQIAGYVQSPQRTPGLHALVDVGGGTMDVVTFIVHRLDEEDTFPFLVPAVKWLGTQMLNQNRLVEAPPVADALLPDDLLPISDAKKFAAATGIVEAHVEKRDSIMSEAVRAVVAGVFATTKARRYRLSEAWEKGLRTFLTGGGATAPGYSDAVNRGGMTKAKRIDLMPLPLHPKLADFSGTTEEFQRISVACGLAQDAFSLGRIIPAKEVADDEAAELPRADRPDSDEIYAR